MSQYLSEAFKRLDALNEDTFAINDNGLEDLVKFRDEDEFDNSIDVIDPEATNDEELQDSYVGKVILDCCVCHSKIYKDVEDVVIDGELANTDEECPFCYTTDGYKVIGQVASFDEEAGDEETPEDDESKRSEVSMDEDLLVRGPDGKLTTTSQAGRWGTSKEWDYNNDDSGNPDYWKRCNNKNEGLFDKKDKQLYDVWCQDDDDKWCSREGVSAKEADRDVEDAYLNNEGAPNFKAWKEPSKAKNEGLFDFGKKNKSKQKSSQSGSSTQTPQWELFDIVKDMPTGQRFDNKYDAEKEAAARERDTGHIYKVQLVKNLDEAKTFQNQDIYRTHNGKEEVFMRDLPEKDAKRILKDCQKDARNGDKYFLKPAVDKNGNEAPIKTRKEVRQDKKAAQDAYDERRGSKDTLANKLRMGGLPSQRYAVVHDDGYEDTHLTKKQARGAVAAAKRDGKEAQMYRQKFDKDGNVKQDDKYKREDLEEGIFGPKKDSTEYRNKITNFRNEAAKITGVDSLTSLATEVANLTNEAVEFLRQSHTDEWGEVRGSHYERAEKILKQYDLTIKAVQKAKSFSDVSYEVDALIDEILSGVKDRFAIIRKLNKYRIGLLDSIDSDKAVKKDMLEEFRYQVYIKLSNIKGKLQKRSYVRLFESRLKENVNNLSLDTDDTHLEVSTDESGKLTVSTSPIGATDTEVEGDSDGEVITPLEPETQNEISDNVGDGEEIEIDMDEFDEESFDELGESYLKKVYENVNSFKTSRVSFIKNKLIVEGVIKFNSGKSKKTNFIFESREATKSGKVRFIGENKEIARGKKSFTVTGRVAGNKFLSESFNYNYGVRGADGKAQRLYGTVRRSK